MVKDCYKQKKEKETAIVPISDSNCDNQKKETAIIPISELTYCLNQKKKTANVPGSELFSTIIYGRSYGMESQCAECGETKYRITILKVRYRKGLIPVWGAIF